MFRQRVNKVYDQKNQGGADLGKQIGKIVGIVAVVFFAIYMLVGSVYSLKENEYAVVSTFGVPSIVEEPGIHLKFPYVQKLSKVPKTINGFVLSDIFHFINLSSNNLFITITLR